MSDDGKQWQMEVFYPVVDSLVCERKRRFLDLEIVKLSTAADAVMALNDADGTIQELLNTCNAVLKINPSLLKAEMHVVRSSKLTGLQRFNPSNPERFSPPLSEDHYVPKIDSRHCHPYTLNVTFHLRLMCMM